MTEHALRRTLPRLLAALLLVCPFAVAAATFEVGPAGTFMDLQDAIDAAVDSASADEIRIQSGTYTESVSIPFGLDSDLEISGGWDAAFSTQTIDPALTVVGDVATGRIFDIEQSGADVTIDNLTVRGGSLVDDDGAGLLIAPSGVSTVTLRRCRVTGNTITVDLLSAKTGAGVRARIAAGQRLVVHDCRFDNNLITGGGGQGVGLHASVLFTNSSIELLRNRIDHNSNTLDGVDAQGVGLEIEMSGEATGLVADNVIEDNTINGTTTAGNRASGVDIGLLGNSFVRFERNRVLRNVDLTTGFAPQLRLEVFGASLAQASDNLVADGAPRGVVLSSDVGTELLAINFTVVDHTGTGLSAFPGGPGQIAVENTIAFGNGTETNLTADVAAANNLIGVDPLFVDAASGDYRLLAGSTAIDMGGSRAGSAFGRGAALGAWDVLHAPRVNGVHVDIGAHEFGSIFGDGFETGDPVWWAASVP